MLSPNANPSWEIEFMRNTDRRTILRGLGSTAMSLPWLESLSAKTGKVPSPPQRAAWYYVPIGVVRRGFFPGEADAAIPAFTSSRERILPNQTLPLGLQEWNLTPTQEPLAKHKDKLTFITGLNRVFQEGTDVHAQCASAYLTSAAPYTVTQSPYPIARTLDHVIADHIGKDTPFRTLEFSCNSHKDNKESIQFDNISWYGTGHVAPSMRDPRKVYERLFGMKDSEASRDITDLVLSDAKTLQRELGQADKAKFEEFFDSVRAMETQMARLDKLRGEIAKNPMDEPPDAHLPRGEYIRVMGDLFVHALQTGLTRVATFMIGPERWDTPYTYESLFEKPRSHHQMSHNQGKYIEDLLKVDKFHMEQFAYILGKMDTIQEANGTTLLDNTIFTYGSGLGDGATHQYSALPIIMAGSGGGKLRTGQLLNLSDTVGAGVRGPDKQFPKAKGGEPLANLWLTQIEALGIQEKRYADSTGVLGQLLV